MNQRKPIDAFASRSRYIPIRKLGKGAFGAVFLFKCVSDGILQAVKLIPEKRCKRKTWCSKKQCLIPDEVYLTQNLTHNNLLKIEEIYFEQKCWVLVMEYLPNYIELSRYILVNGRLDEKDARIVLNQLVDVCNYLISKGIDHRDLKGENILYNPHTKHIKLIDFGCASLISGKRYTGLQGTPLYIPPEFYRCGSYLALPAITWAIGCLAFFILNGYRPFKTSKDIEFKSLTTMDPSLRRGSRDFLQDLLQTDESKRILPTQLRYHPWLR